MASKKHLIIGSSSAGISAAEKIRSIAPDDEIKLVTMEEYYPYSPTSLPYLLAGRITEKELPLRGEGYFQAMKVSLALSKEVVRVLPQKKEVVYKDGSSESYDTLLIASGSKPAVAPINGLDGVGVLEFHALSDCRKLLQKLDTKITVAIYGGGLVATELAASLLERKCRVKIIVRSYLLRRYVDRDLAAIIQHILSSEGAEIFSGAEIRQVRKKRDGIEITNSTGEVISADILVNAIGVQPRVSFLEGTGIKIGTGVLVDRRMKTNIEDVYAAGDVAEGPDFFTGKPEMNPILPNAVAQGRIAGSNMAGQKVEYEGGISMNIFHFFGHTAFSVGQAVSPSKDVQILKEIDEGAKSFRKLVFDQGRLIGAMFLNAEADPGILHYLIEKRIKVSPHEKLLLERTKEAGRWLMLAAEKRESVLSGV